jgi:acyl carrier protein
VDLEDKIKELVADNLSVEVSDIHLSDELAVDLGADSLDLVELIMAIEDEYNIEVPDTDMAEGIKTIQDVITYVQKRLSS